MQVTEEGQSPDVNVETLLALQTLLGDGGSNRAQFGQPAGAAGGAAGGGAWGAGFIEVLAAVAAAADGARRAAKVHRTNAPPGETSPNTTCCLCVPLLS